ncbi:apolipoprotein N-acyltransferase [Oceanispirochaeta crateris]|uniref:Apolipoprotein N-acyltransferase n=1 Tax=Oceanispirochaeta crateris TaxID=2518645 RepID=A0A5C1QLZ4_9SPIO|nr:apolipoprotein N-acyltransferase [Oceanispirochaeta crateris]QEN08671.1 apolipoprotein N-acyltransferase [Oceanispirochaeta crateris]
MMKILEKYPWLADLFLLLSGSLLFALSFPNFLYRWGFGFLAWFALIPVFLLIHRAGFLKSILYGALYGYFAYSLFNFWLAKFNPTSFVVVPLIYAVYFMFWFPVFKWADKTFPRWGYLMQLVFWLAFEIFRTKGFLGYSYGILGYSQYRNLSVIGISDLTGVLGVSGLLVFPSLWIARYLIFRKEVGGAFSLLKKAKFLAIPGCLYLLILTGSLVYSHVNRVDYDDSPVWKTSLIQHDINAWLSGTEVYAKALDKLLELSEEAMADEPDAVVWSETSFVPSIQWHNKRREDRERLALVQRLLDFLEDKDTPFLIGNNDSELSAGKMITYNSVLQFQGKDIVDNYRKIHLVPFGEHFPYTKLFPRFYEYILDNGATFYEKGAEYSVFDVAGVKASPLICFEDTFGYLSRNFVREGAQVLVNVTNDSWSPAQACSIQHVGMAVFRSVENRRSMIRATNGGFTCLIDPNGKIVEYLEPFTADILTVDVPVYDGVSTVYTRTNFLFDRLIMILSIIFGIGLTLFTILKKRGEK